MDLDKLGQPALDKVGMFMDCLEEVRRQLPSVEWKSAVASSKPLRQWRYFLCNDPYTRWAFMKPRGYPGDATVMDFAYKHASIRGEVSKAGEVGQEIYRHTSSSMQSNSARLRIEFIASEIDNLCKKALNPVTIASFASGHGRELELLGADYRAKILTFVAIDSDLDSLATLASSAGEIPVCKVNRNVLRLKDATAAYDLVYSLGLFDYLDDRQAKAVAAKMWSTLRPGGTMIIANLSHTAGNLGYCEAVMDWWMTTRSQNDLAAIGCCSAGKDDPSQVNLKQLGCFNYLSITKP